MAWYSVAETSSWRFTTLVRPKKSVPAGSTLRSPSSAIAETRTAGTASKITEQVSAQSLRRGFLDA